MLEKMSIKWMLIAGITSWAFLGWFMLGTPALFIYILMHLCTSGLFTFAIMRKMKQNELEA